MYIDAFVLAGIGTVALMLSFFGGFGYFIYRDSHKKTLKAKPRQQG